MWQFSRVFFPLALRQFQEWTVGTLLDQINCAIHAWPCRTEYKRQLSSSAKIMDLFAILEMTGRHVSVPEVIWDAGGQSGMVKIGNVWKVYH
jgi:hypothetical protein